MKRRKQQIYTMDQLMTQKVFFCAADKITIRLVRKAGNSLYKQDIVFVNIYNGLENKKFLLEKVPVNAPFVEKKNLYNVIEFQQTF